MLPFQAWSLSNIPPKIKWLSSILHLLKKLKNVKPFKDSKPASNYHQTLKSKTFNRFCCNTDNLSLCTHTYRSVTLLLIIHHISIESVEKTHLLGENINCFPIRPKVSPSSPRVHSQAMAKSFGATKLGHYAHTYLIHLLWTQIWVNWRDWKPDR